ncbi:MAG: HK97 family phage prohead protease, partial [Afipia sp.]|nr:HK97 family phage prohead protease [Afipia sp.]
MEDIAVEGYAILYNEPLFTNGEINVIESGSLSNSLKGSAPIYLQVNHDKERRIASTNDALAFVDDAVGLGFRVDLEETKNGSYIKQLVSSRQNAAVSVGLTIEEDRVEKIGKHSVRFISRARLNEISLVREGACKDAFAGVVNTSYSEPVAAGRK